MPDKAFDPQRRNLAKSVVFGAVAVAALPISTQAATADAETNVVFTEGDTGHWAGYESLHVPVVTAASGVLTVKTPHPMNDEHFIVSHSVVLADGTFLGRKTFTSADTPVSTYKLPSGYSGGVTVTSTCNLHDFWVKRLSV